MTDVCYGYADNSGGNRNPGKGIFSNIYKDTTMNALF